MGNDQYLVLFIEESQEHIQSLNDRFLELENDSTNIDNINEIFRSVHTIKGMAGTMGFKSIAELTHSMENILDAARNGKIILTSYMLDVLFNSLDTLEGLLQDIVATGREGNKDIKELKIKLKNIMEDEDKPSNNTSSANIQNGTYPSFEEYEINVIEQALNKSIYPLFIEIELQSSCMLKSARAYLVFKTLEQFGEIIKSIPSSQDIEEEKFDRSFSLLLLTNLSKSVIYEELCTISEIEKIHISEIDIKEMKQNIEKQDTNFKEVDLDKDIQGSTNKTSLKQSTRSIRVDIDRLDHLMNLVSELIIIKNSIEGTSEFDRTQGMSQHMEYLGRVTTELHEAVMKVRMVPVGLSFNRFPRVVRDLAKQVKKEIRLNIIGADTEVDRTIIDEIGDPLIHLIRNSVDHGIESPQDRLAKGKEEIGNIDLCAYHDGNNVVIEVKDDGIGIDYRSISAKAIKLGLLTKEQADDLKDHEIIDFLFHPGFSTSEKITDISGRGVGLDVVKTKIESLGGIIEIETIRNKGTRFIVRLPLTLSIIQALLVKVGQEIFAIPLSSIKEVVELPSNSINIVGQHELISHRDELIPLIRLDRTLDIQTDGEKDYLTTVIVRKGDKVLAFLVDTLIGQQEIVIKSLGQYLANIKIISGATILGDGSIALILDINHIA